LAFYDLSRLIDDASSCLSFLQEGPGVIGVESWWVLYLASVQLSADVRLLRLSESW